MAGKPVLTFPLFADQHTNADLLVRRGCALRLDPKRFTAAQLGALASQMLSRGKELGAAVRSTRELLAATGGAPEAIRIIMGVAAAAPPAAAAPAAAAPAAPAAGLVALVTGANSGLGLETCKALARLGYTVLMGCRSVAKGEAAAAEVRAQLPGGGAAPAEAVRVMQVDASSLAAADST